MEETVLSFCFAICYLLVCCHKRANAGNHNPSTVTCSIGEEGFCKYCSVVSGIIINFMCIPEYDVGWLDALCMV